MPAPAALFLDASATFTVCALLVSWFYPRLLLLECVAAAIPVGITASAWCGLLVKSFLPTGYVRVCVNACVVVVHVAMGGADRHGGEIPRESSAAGKPRERCALRSPVL